MIKIGILGTDNSHSIGFSTEFNVSKEVKGGQVVAVYGDDEARTLDVATRGQIPTIVKKPTDMIGLVDAAIVDFRHGSRHLQFAKPLIQAGIPTFIDKPFAATPADAKAMVALSKKHKTPITTFSTLRFGAGLTKFKEAVAKIGNIKTVVLTGPGNARDPHDGIFFYAVHQVEMLLEVFGYDVVSVRGMDYSGTLVASVLYKNGMIATIHETCAVHSPFTAMAFGSAGKADYDSTSSPDMSLAGTRALFEMFKTGRMPLTYDQMTASTRILWTIQQSAKKKGVTLRIPR